VAVVYILSLFIQIMDTTIVNIAIPTLADEFGVDATDVEWAVIGFALALAAVIPVAGWMGDRFGTRRVFLVAIAGFVVTSMLCGAAQTLDQLIAARVFQGLFAGLITRSARRCCSGPTPSRSGPRPRRPSSAWR
jgi:MFS family permease